MKRIILFIITVLFSSAVFCAPAKQVESSPQVKMLLPVNQTIDMHTLKDSGTYGISGDNQLINAPPVTGSLTIVIAYAWTDDNIKLVIQNLFGTDGQIYTETYNSKTNMWSEWTKSGGGTKGDKGEKGDIGPQGLPGAKGDTGAQGIQGVAGKDGANGKDAVNPMTTQNDMIVGGASGVPTRLAAGADTYVLTSANGIPTWKSQIQANWQQATTTDPSYINGKPASNQQPNFTTKVGNDFVTSQGYFAGFANAVGTNLSYDSATGKINAPAPGMTNPMSSIGDMIYAGANGVPTQLRAGTAGQVLTLSSAAPITPSWQTPANTLSFNVPISTVYADAAVPSDITLRNSSGTAQITQKGLLCNANGLFNVQQLFSITVNSGQTINISGRVTFYNLNTITTPNYYVNIQVVGVTTGGQLVNLGTSATQTVLSKVQYAYTNADFRATQTLVTNLVAIGIQAQILYGEANNTALVNTMFAQLTIN